MAEDWVSAGGRLDSASEFDLAAFEIFALCDVESSATQSSGHQKSNMKIFLVCLGARFFLSYRVNL